MMNHVKSALLSGQRPHHLAAASAAAPQQLVAAASFHSTPPLQRKRKTQWHRWVRDSKTNSFRPHDFYYGNFRSRGGFEFCTSDEDGPETVFRNAFRGNQHTCYWTFDSDNFQWRNSRHSHSESSRRWSCETDDEDEISTQTEVSLARQALGLSTSGPLKLEDVKSAYRTCALRWHPDRHHGSSKATAEEKFKHCSAAYKTLCDSLATA